MSLFNAKTIKSAIPPFTGNNDKRNGISGPDRLDGLSGDDTISGLAGNDTLLGSDGADVLNGGSGNDSLIGGMGEDTLNGGGGIDRLIGGNGSDTYLINNSRGRIVNSQDRIVERSGEGDNDRVQVNVSFTLPGNVETLTLAAALAIDGSGNALANALIGNSAANQLSGDVGDDTLNGNAGNDTLDGGAGNDTAYYSAPQTDYNVRYDADGNAWTIENVNNGDTDRLIDIERLQFMDGVQNLGSGPVFSSGATATVAENTASGATVYDATANGDSGISYSLLGADAADFGINPSDGTVSLAFLPDYENPIDHDGNNVYDFSVRATDADGRFADQAVALTVTDVAAESLAGQPVIDLGPDYGKLIHPVNVDGNWYYYWDRSGDGGTRVTAEPGVGYTNIYDFTTHDVLDGIFTEDINGTVGGGGNTDDTYRYATLNGVRVALPTMGGEGAVVSYDWRPGTDVGSSPASVGSTADNPVYNDMLAIWDAYNGTGTGTHIYYGVPPGWFAGDFYWSATPSASGHVGVSFDDGGLYDGRDFYESFVVLQVL